MHNKVRLHHDFFGIGWSAINLTLGLMIALLVLLFLLLFLFITGQSVQAQNSVPATISWNLTCDPDGKVYGRTDTCGFGTIQSTDGMIWQYSP